MISIEEKILKDLVSKIEMQAKVEMLEKNKNGIQRAKITSSNIQRMFSRIKTSKQITIMGSDKASEKELYIDFYINEANIDTEATFIAENTKDVIGIIKSILTDREIIDTRYSTEIELEHLIQKKATLAIDKIVSYPDRSLKERFKKIIDEYLPENIYIKVRSGQGFVSDVFFVDIYENIIKNKQTEFVFGLTEKQKNAIDNKIKAMQDKIKRLKDEISGIEYHISTQKYGYDRKNYVSFILPEKYKHLSMHIKTNQNNRPINVIVYNQKTPSTILAEFKLTPEIKILESSFKKGVSPFEIKIIRP